MKHKLLSERIQSNSNVEFSLSPPFPTKRMLVELSNICNHKCIFCANRKMTREKGFINEDFLQRILQEAYSCGVREVGLYSTGEPFVSKELPKYIKWAKDIGYTYVYITTNGALANPERLKQVFDSGLDSIKFSINAGSKDTYKLIHGRDDFEKVTKNILFCYEYRKLNKLNYNIFISFVVTNHTVNETE